MSAPGIPPTGTFFTTLKKSFTDVNINEANNGIDTESFLDAAQSTTTLFDLLGSVAFTPVKNDMLGNITKLRTRYLAHPLLSKTLQSLVRSELSQKTHTATEGLLWLVRGLDFTAQALRQDLTANADTHPSEVKPKQELADGFKASYKQTLAPYHSWLIKPVFSAAMSATPYRRDMYAKLVGSEVDPQVAQEQMHLWVTALEERVAILKTFMASRDAKW